MPYFSLNFTTIDSTIAPTARASSEPITVLPTRPAYIIPFDMLPWEKPTMSGPVFPTPTYSRPIVNSTLFLYP